MTRHRLPRNLDPDASVRRSQLSADPDKSEQSRQFGDRAGALSAGFVIRRLRELKGISQLSLARSAPANLSYISALENHPSNVSIHKMMQLCRGLDLPPHTVMQLLYCLSESARVAYPEQADDYWQIAEDTSSDTED